MFNHQLNTQGKEKEKKRTGICRERLLINLVDLIKLANNIQPDIREFIL